VNHSDIHRRFLKNASMIVGSRTVFGLLNLGTNAIILRVFGAADLGMVMLLIAYIRMFAEVVKFQSWQAVLRFGTIMMENGEHDQLRRLVGLTFAVDFVSMLMAIAASILLIPTAAAWFGWNDQVTAMAPWFMILIVFVTNATSNGVLRLFDRVEILALQHGLNAVIRFALVLLVMFMGGAVKHLALAWFVAFVISGLTTIVFCAMELRKRDLRPILWVNWWRANTLFPGIWRFLIMSNLISAGPLFVNHVTTMLIGAQLGAAQAAVLQIARQLSSGISRPARLLGPLLLPDYSRLSGRGDWAGLRDLVVQQIKMTVVVVLAVGMIFFSILPFLVSLLFGPDMLDHIWLFRLLIITSLINIIGFSLQHAMFSANKGGTALLIQFVAILVYAVIMLSGLWVIGLNAVGFGMVGFAITSRGLTLMIGRRLLNKRIKRKEYLGD